MTCEDCIHYDICVFHVKGNENEKCSHFKNKTDFEVRTMLKTKNNDQSQKFISRLSTNGEKVVDSELFENVHYLIKENHIVILAGKSGELAIAFDKLDSFITELWDIGDFWKNDNNGKCLILTQKRGRKR